MNNITDKYKEQALVMKALSHPTRLFIVDELARNEKCVQDIANMVKVDISTISKHLNILKIANVVGFEKRGNCSYYKLIMPCVLDFMVCACDVSNE